MRIYIDESGNFRPGDTQSRVCCECALVVPEPVADELAARFSSLRSTWTAEPEIKGSSLTDEQHQQVLILVGQYDVLVEIVAMDCSQPAQEIESFCRRAGDAIVENLTPKHHANAHRFFHKLKRDWGALPTQLQAQLYILMLTIEEVIRTAPNYYMMRLPDDLGRFDWILDPKDIKPTSFETVWERMVCPILQTRSVDEPSAFIGDIDSVFDRFRMETPGYLSAVVGRRPNATSLDLKLLLRESVAFPDSRDTAGLQIVDALASTFTKAMNGKIAPEVWRPLAKLMVEKPGRAPTARLVALGHGPRQRASDYHSYVLNALRNRAKKMFPPETPGASC